MEKEWMKDAGGGQPRSGAEYDIAVIGGGPAGYVAAIRAAQLGRGWSFLSGTRWEAPV